MGLRHSKDIPTNVEDPSRLERFKIILTLRYHNTRILLHRPILVKFLDILGKPTVDKQELSLLQQIGSNSLKNCVESSMEIISIVHMIVKSIGVQRSLLGAWWFSLYYSTFSVLQRVQGI